MLDDQAFMVMDIVYVSINEWHIVGEQYGWVDPSFGMLRDSVGFVLSLSQKYYYTACP